MWYCCDLWWERRSCQDETGRGEDKRGVRMRYLLQGSARRTSTAVYVACHAFRECQWPSSFNKQLVRTVRPAQPIVPHFHPSGVGIWDVTKLLTIPLICKKLKGGRFPSAVLKHDWHCERTAISNLFCSAKSTFDTARQHQSDVSSKTPSDVRSHFFLHSYSCFNFLLCSVWLSPVANWKGACSVRQHKSFQKELNSFFEKPRWASPGQLSCTKNQLHKKIYWFLCYLLVSSHPVWFAPCLQFPLAFCNAF